MRLQNKQNSFNRTNKCNCAGDNIVIDLVLDSLFIFNKALLKPYARLIHTKKTHIFRNIRPFQHVLNLRVELIYH